MKAGFAERVEIARVELAPRLPLAALGGEARAQRADVRENGAGVERLLADHGRRLQRIMPLSVRRPRASVKAGTPARAPRAERKARGPLSGAALGTCE